MVAETRPISRKKILRARRGVELNRIEEGLILGNGRTGDGLISVFDCADSLAQRYEHDYGDEGEFPNSFKDPEELASVPNGLSRQFTDYTWLNKIFRNALDAVIMGDPTTSTISVHGSVQSEMSDIDYRGGQIREEILELHQKTVRSNNILANSNIAPLVHRIRSESSRLYEELIPSSPDIDDRTGRMLIVLQILYHIPVMALTSPSDLDGLRDTFHKSVDGFEETIKRRARRWADRRRDELPLSGFFHLHFIEIMAEMKEERVKRLSSHMHDTFHMRDFVIRRDVEDILTSMRHDEDALLMLDLKWAEVQRRVRETFPIWDVPGVQRSLMALGKFTRRATENEGRLRGTYLQGTLKVEWDKNGEQEASILVEHDHHYRILKLLAELHRLEIMSDNVYDASPSDMNFFMSNISIRTERTYSGQKCFGRLMQFRRGKQNPFSVDVSGYISAAVTRMKKGTYCQDTSFI